MESGEAPGLALTSYPTFVITHRMKLNQAADGYDIFSSKEDDRMKIVMTP